MPCKMCVHKTDIGCVNRIHMAPFSDEYLHVEIASKVIRLSSTLFYCLHGAYNLLSLHMSFV